MGTREDMSETHFSREPTRKATQEEIAAWKKQWEELLAKQEHSTPAVDSAWFSAWNLVDELHGNKHFVRPIAHRCRKKGNKAWDIFVAAMQIPFSEDIEHDVKEIYSSSVKALADLPYEPKQDFSGKLDAMNLLNAIKSAIEKIYPNIAERSSARWLATIQTEFKGE